MLILTVTQINTYLASKISEDKKLTGVMIKGEISNFVDHRSGHFYFTLKDKESSINAVMFKNFASRLKFLPEDGMDVILSGSVKVYEKNGNCQIYVTDIVPNGIGAVHVANEQLKEKLRREGVFDPSSKRPIPPLPARIGVVTSRTGAALQDILNILSRRYPIAELILAPALVQGESAPDSVAQSLMKLSRADCDVIILARGGGSAEDLSAFNTETVAYAVYNSSVPVISAVGHETDFTIADMAADMRVPTPSAAAERVSLSVDEISGQLRYYSQRLDTLLSVAAEKKQYQLQRLADKLRGLSYKNKLSADRERFSGLLQRLESTFAAVMEKNDNKVRSYSDKLEALSPLRVLERGYSLVYRDGVPVTRGSKLKTGDKIQIRMSDGVITAEITGFDKE